MYTLHYSKISSTGPFCLVLFDFVYLLSTKFNIEAKLCTINSIYSKPRRRKSARLLTSDGDRKLYYQAKLSAKYGYSQMPYGSNCHIQNCSLSLYREANRAIG